jgi:ketosteroid isomerase-like protein
VKAPIADLADFAALDPFFRIIEKGLDGLAGPGQFFDLLAEDILTEYVVTVPGYPARVEGRAALAELYRPYGTFMVVDYCSDLAVYHDPAKSVAVLEYSCHGHAVATGSPYRNQFISVLNPVAVFDALGWPKR